MRSVSLTNLDLNMVYPSGTAYNVKHCKSLRGSFLDNKQCAYLTLLTFNVAQEVSPSASPLMHAPVAPTST